MGVRKDLDSEKTRYVYYLKHNGKVLYVGTAVSPKARYKKHLKNIADNKALIYQYCRFYKIKPTLEIKTKLNGDYRKAENIEIEHIVKHQETVLNFYNNPNKTNYYKQMEIVNG